jgi:hypothetical protein
LKLNMTDLTRRWNSKSVAFDPASIFRVELNGPQSGISHDQLNVTGAANLGGCTLQATLGYPGAVGAQFLILTTLPATNTHTLFRLFKP